MAETEDGRPRRGDDGVPEIVESEGVLGGDPRIAGTRIGVFHVYRRHDGGESPESIATGLDVPVGAVYAALAYAVSNPEEMDRIAERNREAREEAPNRVRPDDLG